MNPHIRGLHHNAYRCRDSEETRRFYEDFLGLPLAGTLAIGETKTGRATQALHTFYRLGDGSYLAFFEVPDMPFEFMTIGTLTLDLATSVPGRVPCAPVSAAVLRTRATLRKIIRSHASVAGAWSGTASRTPCSNS